jgi:nucleoside 2-deoxyribosyltransferase
MSQSSTMPKIYLAGPTVFHRDALALGARLKALCADKGLEGLYPLDGPPLSDPHAIYVANVAKIVEADALIADLSLFRGPHADDGTAFELGYAAALGKPIFAYATTVGSMVDRIDSSEVLEDGRRMDAEGWQIEDFDLPHNLMLACSVECIATSPEDAIALAATRLLPMDEAQAKIVDRNRV